MIGQKLGHYRIVEKLGEDGMGFRHHCCNTSLDRQLALRLIVALLVSIVTGAAGQSASVAEASRLPGHFVEELAVSPDGSRLVYVGSRGGQRQLYLRLMSQPEVRPIPGTDGAGDPFFSPDGEWIGFFAHGKLKKLSVRGGEPLTVCDAPSTRGGSWGPDHTIVFTPGFGANIGLSRVPAAGGKPGVLTTPDARSGEHSHRYPEILPGGRWVLYTAWAWNNWESARIAVQSLQTGKRRVLLKGGSHARYAPSGHLVYAREGKLFAVPFDLTKLALTGTPRPVLEGVGTYPSEGQALFSFSRSGLLVYVPAEARPTERTLAWVDRKGEEKPLTEPRRQYSWPRLSPEGRRLAVSILEGAKEDIWVYDLERDALRRLTFDTGSNVYPLWTPDGKRITFSSNRVGPWNLYWKPADGSGTEERLTTSPHTQFATSWSRDGKVLAFYEVNPTTAGDIWLLLMDGARKPKPFLQTPFIEGVARFSPDGRWLAYASNESGRSEVYVQPYPGPGGKWKVSIEGGSGPAWAGNGRELFYRNGDKMMVVDVTTEPTFATGRPRLVFEGAYDFEPGQINYDVTTDGQRFVMVKQRQPEPLAKQLKVVHNWFEELNRLVPPGKK